MIATVKYVENSQKKIGITSKNKTKKRLKLFRKKPAASLPKFIICKIIYVIIPFVVIIVSYLDFIRLLFVGPGSRQIKRKYILYHTTKLSFKHDNTFYNKF